MPGNSIQNRVMEQGIKNMEEGAAFKFDYCVTEEIYNGFIDLFKDNNPLHTDEGFAKEKNFSGKVMHGAILVGFLSHFIGECLPEKNVIVHGYKINYVKPVYLNDRLTLEASITGVFESVNSIEFKYRFINSTKSTVAKGDISIGII